MPRIIIASRPLMILFPLLFIILGGNSAKYKNSANVKNIDDLNQVYPDEIHSSWEERKKLRKKVISCDFWKDERTRSEITTYVLVIVLFVAQMLTVCWALR